MLQNYQQLIEKISRASGLSVEEVDRKVEAKCAKLSGLISKEGSAQIVASELGISFEKEKMKISELVSGMKRVNIIGKVISDPLIREFNKNGRGGKVLSMDIADDTGNIRVVLWDTNHISLFEKNELNKDDVIEISNSSVRNDELHLGSFSDIKKSKEIFSSIIMEKSVPERKISELKAGMRAKLRAFVVQIFEPRFFEVCPECGKKSMSSECATHGTIIPEKRALIGIVLDDGSETIRGVLFQEQISQIGISIEELSDAALFMRKKMDLLGNEFYFICNTRNNNLFNTMELIIQEVKPLDLDVLIHDLRA
ncbi:MAG: OB-fold nucleic acid binding domain-containing protein [Candidatus Pacearchaeota archaeon]